MNKYTSYQKFLRRLALKETSTNAERRRFIEIATILKELENLAAADVAILQRCVYDTELDDYVHIRSLVYWGDVLMISGGSKCYKVSEYQLKWRLNKQNEND